MFRYDVSTQGVVSDATKGVIGVAKKYLEYLTDLFPNKDKANKAHYLTKSVTLRAYTAKIDELTPRDYMLLSEQRVPTLIGLQIPMFTLYVTLEKIIGHYIDDDFNHVINTFSDFLTKDKSRIGILYTDDVIDKMTEDIEELHKELSNCFGNSSDETVKLGKLFRNTKDIHDSVEKAVSLNGLNINDLTSKVYKQYEEINDITASIVKLLSRDIKVYEKNGKLFAKHVAYAANYFSLFSATVELLEDADNVLLTILKDKIK